jgi:hypothetical protein
MNIHPDFQELLSLLEKHNVRYMIVGGYAVAFHGFTRNTKDLDIFYEISEDNAQRIHDALVEFGFGAPDVPAEEFLKPDDIAMFGKEPVRVDLINSVSGLRFEEAEANMVRGIFGTIEANYVSKEDLIRNKTASGRFRDMDDVERLTK